MTYRKRRKTTSLLVGAAASIVAVGLAGPAGAAPTAQQSAQATIGMLQAQGFHVMISKIGDGPIDQCTVKAVRPGRKASQLTNPPIRAGVRNQPPASPTVYVDLACKP
ncbi:hypothetical protein ACP6C3_31245 [Mycolicibacterium septicum]|jgi:hypothetical protein|uniref:PASTA domain-containing protein n=5 Tax=Mycolicibacterium TaxID=1866885 RepID=A0A0J8UDS5_9MYCO|nr:MULTISPECIES: hypothetical protein [Mycolicibacterium]KLI04296.1 hypothetical protein AA982_30700 [Mycolicibacterium senegalense]KLO50414.1 hypothetical protein ABW05_01690 [Mycolicibacterium senegalense]KMV19107.1 hypothetical protein ACT17_06505 [Mycolicibacterium conceptionense]MCA4727033.1 hypothetical protein [Mycolicibacterium fortuitum]MCV7200643.1 hypothetical protein [Mycolicibacterium peregrinum]